MLYFLLGKDRCEDLLFLSAIIVFVLIGCATTPSHSSMSVVDADMRMVENCRLLGNVHGTSGFGALFASVGIENAKNEAREKAASMEATHLVWAGMAGGKNPYVNARAYLCK
jgi:hypothetical protein